MPGGSVVKRRVRARVAGASWRAHLSSSRRASALKAVLGTSIFTRRVKQSGYAVRWTRTSRADGRDTHQVSRKVRAPQGRVVVNSDPG